MGSGKTFATYALRNFGQVNGDLRRRDTDTNTVQNSTGDQRANTGCGDLDGGADKPPEAREHDAITTTPFIGDRACYQTSHHGTSGQSRADSALDNTRGVMEVLDVLRRDDDGRDGRDVETKEHTSYRGDDRHEVGIRY